MIKIKNSADKVVFIVSDDATEPIAIEDLLDKQEEELEKKESEKEESK